MTLTDTIIGQIGGGGGGPLLDARAWDTLAPTDRLRKRGTVLAYDDFELGYGGWANHFHYATASTIISRTSQNVFSGDKCLLISPHELPMNQAEKWKGAGAYKRMGFPKKIGVQSLSAQIAIRGGRGNELLTEKKYPFERVWMGMDTQLPDGSKRFFGVAYLKDEGDGTTAWYLKGGYASSVAGAATNPDVKIPGSENWMMGLNEWKGNFNYVRLTVDLAAAAAGTGYYLELQIGNRVFDLKKMGLPVPHDLLLKNGSLDTFTGGNNAGFGVSRSILNPTFNQVQLLVDNVLVTTDDLALAA